MNRIIIIGNLTRDPETGTTQNGANWTRFSVAVNRRKGKDQTQETDYMRVTVWQGLAETCARYLSKGKKVAVVGTAGCYAWVKQDGKTAGGQIEINGQEVEFLSSGSSGSSGLSAPPEEPDWVKNAGGGAADGMTPVDPDDIPY